MIYAWKKLCEVEADALHVYGRFVLPAAVRKLRAAAPFSHFDHLRLAYVHLAESDVTSSHAAVKQSLLRYLDYHGVPPSKYHETLTRSWL